MMTKHPFRFTFFLLMCLVLPLTAVATPQLKVTFEGHTDGVDSIAFSPNSNTLASGSRDSTIRLWDIEKEEPIAVLQAGQIRTIAFSPDGNTLASGSYDGAVKLWDVASLSEKAVLSSHTQRIESVAFSPDDQHRWRVGAMTGPVRLWDVDTRQLKFTLTGHTAGVESIAFSPEGVLASGRHDEHGVRCGMPGLDATHSHRCHIQGESGAPRPVQMAVPLPVDLITAISSCGILPS